MNIKQKIVAHATAVIMTASLLMPFAVVHAQVTNPLTPTTGAAQVYLNQVAVGSGQSQTSATVIIGSIIYTILGLLGLIFLVLALYAGFGWMTAQGDSKKVDSAKDTLKDAVVGMVIVVSAYALSNFIVAQLGNIGQ